MREETSDRDKWKSISCHISGISKHSESGLPSCVVARRTDECSQCHVSVATSSSDFKMTYSTAMKGGQNSRASVAEVEMWTPLNHL